MQSTLNLLCIGLAIVAIHLIEMHLANTKIECKKTNIQSAILLNRIINKCAVFLRIALFASFFLSLSKFVFIE